MALEAGRTLSHYRLTEPLGQGGMGVVWKAHDTKLGRDVALKFLPDLFAHDAERLARFEREARVLASLGHPHVASIFDLETADSLRFLVMELVEGPDLSQRLAEGPLPLDEVVRAALQIAEALEHAHEKGVVHRDLKPSNIKLTSGGAIKVLDFGLAKALEGGESGGAATSLLQSPTITGHMTAANVLLGTAAYMAPEQARGQAADRRADIWAFGVVVHEMLSGKRVFEGDTISDTLASVLKTDPDFSQLPGDTPERLRRLIRRCLERDPRRRLRDIGEARILLEDMQRGVADETAPTATTSRPPGHRRAFVAVFAAGGLVLGAIATFAVLRATRPPRAEVPLRRFIVQPAAIDAVPHSPVLSPSGKTLAYLAGDKLWIQDLGALEPREIRVEPGASRPFWSPDEKSIAYLAGTRVMRVSVSGGDNQVVCDTRRAFTGGSGGTWTEDGKIVISHGDSLGLQQVSAAGTDPRTIVPPDRPEEGDLHQPSALPGGRGFLFAAHRKAGIDNICVWSNGKRKTLLQLPGQTLAYPQYAASGHILFSRIPTTPGIWALPFSLSRLEATGEPFLVAAAGTSPSVANDGTLAYGGGSGAAHQLVWVARNGGELGSIGPTRAQGLFAAAPGGTRAACVESEGDNDDIWIYDSARGTRTRFTFETADESAPSWSPDGERIVYQALPDKCQFPPSCMQIVMRRADGTGSADTLGMGAIPSFSSDGRYVAFTSFYQQTGERWDVSIVDLEGDRSPKLVVRGNERTVGSRIAPRGDLMAYMSDESGQWEVYLTRFPSGESKWQVSVAGGQWPRWNGKGDRLYYVQSDDIMEVEVAGSAGTPALGTPHKLFTRQALGAGSFGFFVDFDVVADGQRFLVARSADERARPVGITVVQNWAAAFVSSE